MADGAIVRRKLHVDAGIAKFVDPRSEVGGPDTVVEGDAVGCFHGRCPAVTAAAEQFAGIGEERRLPDAAGDEGDVRHWGEGREAIAQWPPDAELIAD